jgi:hypothetical protein
MHSFYVPDNASPDTTFHYNSDLSGDVKISRRDGGELDVPGEALIEFIANYVRNERIGQLEQEDPRVILGLKPARRRSEKKS